MRVDHRVCLPETLPASGRLRFSITGATSPRAVRLMVLDDIGKVQHKMTLDVRGPRTPVQLTGFPRGRTYLVCAFADDDLIWSSPVQSG